MEVTQAKFSSDFRTFFFPAQLKLDLLGSPWSHQNYFRFLQLNWQGPQSLSDLGIRKWMMSQPVEIRWFLGRKRVVTKATNLVDQCKSSFIFKQNITLRKLTAKSMNICCLISDETASLLDQVLGVCIQLALVKHLHVDEALKIKI